VSSAFTLLEGQKAGADSSEVSLSVGLLAPVAKKLVRSLSE